MLFSFTLTRRISHARSRLDSAPLILPLNNKISNAIAQAFGIGDFISPPPRIANHWTLHSFRKKGERGGSLLPIGKRQEGSSEREFNLRRGRPLSVKICRLNSLSFHVVPAGVRNLSGLLFHTLGFRRFYFWELNIEHAVLERSG